MVALVGLHLLFGKRVLRAGRCRWCLAGQLRALWCPEGPSRSGVWAHGPCGHGRRLEAGTASPSARFPHQGGRHGVSCPAGRSARGSTTSRSDHRAGGCSMTVCAAMETASAALPTDFPPRPGWLIVEAGQDWASWHRSARLLFASRCRLARALADRDAGHSRWAPTCWRPVSDWLERPDEQRRRQPGLPSRPCFEFRSTRVRDGFERQAGRYERGAELQTGRGWRPGHTTLPRPCPFRQAPCVRSGGGNGPAGSGESKRSVRLALLRLDNLRRP